MYFPYFITYIAVGFVISLAVFIWALKNEQFKDQRRARFLPLEKEIKTDTAPVSKLSRYEAYALLFLACAGLLASAAARPGSPTRSRTSPAWISASPPGVGTNSARPRGTARSSPITRSP